MKNNKGYTLIEMLAVIGVFVILVGMISAILFSTVRGSNKSKISGQVSQDGAYAMSLLSNSIIDSGAVTELPVGTAIDDCTTNPTGTSIKLKRLDETTTTFACENNTMTKDGNPVVNSNYTQITSCSFTCQQKSDDPYSIPIISIGFTISDKNANLFENKSSSTLSTKVSLRNYAP